MKPWHIKDPALLDEFKKRIDSKYATLNVVIISDAVFIKGTLFINNKQNKELGRYVIEIKIPDDYPNSTPVVREVGGKFKKIADRHFNPKDETACLFFRDEKYKYSSKDSTIIDFIEVPVKNFFMWQMDYDLNDHKSTLGERGHGVDGLVQFYEEELNICGKDLVVQFLMLFVIKSVPRTRKCYCGSGRMLKDCHIRKFRDLRSKISRKDAKQSLTELEFHLLVEKIGKSAVESIIKKINNTN